MSEGPATRATLLSRLRDLQDDPAWEEFVTIYAPLIYSCARRRGLQDADAADVTQDVLRTATKSLPAFQYDPSRGRFRSWLHTVTCNAARDLLSSKAARGTGDSRVQTLLSNHASPSDDEQSEWERDYQQQLFRRASETVRPAFEESTWLAFWMTAVEGRPPQQAAKDLGISVGAVYIARSRVLARFKVEMDGYQDNKR